MLGAVSFSNDYTQFCQRIHANFMDDLCLRTPRAFEVCYNAWQLDYIRLLAPLAEHLLLYAIRALFVLSHRARSIMRWKIS